MRLPSKLPGSLSRAVGTGSLFTPTGFAYQYAIGGLPFLSAASNQHPIVRETNPVQKNQFDNQNNAGEQTLAGWWMRSQQSFHGGAGQLYGDPQALNTFTSKNDFNQIRFLKSRGIDPWTQGLVSLLPAARKARLTALPALVDATEFTYGDGTDACFAVNGVTFFVITATTVTTPGTAPSATIGTVTTDGSYIYVAAGDGVWSAPIPTTSGGTWTWTKQYTVTTTLKVHMAYVKNRIMLAVGPALYGLASHPASPPAVLPAPVYTNPDPAWTWTGITESSPAIYAVGNNGIRGSIIKLVLDSSGALPVLSGGTVAAQLPSGEVCYSAMGYLGGFVGIGTNKGARVAQVETNGDLTYGPLLFPTDGPVWAWTARDRFLWCTVSRGNDGDSGLYRIDLSVEVDTLRFSYATDLFSVGDTTDCFVAAHLGKSDSLVVGTATDTYTTDTTALMSTGYLQTSRIRYNTLEPKLYKFLRVRGPVLQGPLSYVMLDQFDSASGSHLFPEGQTPGANDSTIDAPTGPQDFVSTKFVFSRDSVIKSQGAQMYGYQLKALPGMPRQRIIQLPLWCFDAEEDPNGNILEVDGSAQARLRALETIDTAGDVVVLQDFTTGVNTRVVIDKVSYVQADPPNHFQGWGGIVTVTMRSV
jgi:hypothetical protein